jgi:hypothetical protein
MPEDKLEPKPEPKPASKQEPGENQSKARRKYVDYNKISTEEAAIMLKRIRKRMTLIINMIDEIMDILKYGAPQGQGQGRKYSGYRSRRNNRKNYGYGNRQYKEDEDEDVNYD